MAPPHYARFYLSRRLSYVNDIKSDDIDGIKYMSLLYYYHFVHMRPHRSLSIVRLSFLDVGDRGVNGLVWHCILQFRRSNYAILIVGLFMRCCARMGGTNR